MRSVQRLPGLTPVDQRADGDRIVARMVAKIRPVSSCSCGGALHRHGRRIHQYADAPLDGHPVRLEVERPRYRCAACGITSSPELAVLDSKRRATRRLIGVIHAQRTTSSLHQIAAATGLAVNTVKAIADEL